MTYDADIFDLDAEQEREAFLGAIQVGTELIQDRDLENILRTRVGRRFAYRLLGGIYKPSHTGNAMNTAFNEGKRDVAIWLYDEIQRLCPDVYPLIHTEHKEDERIIADAARSNEQP